jgi:hypothetical protein
LLRRCAPGVLRKISIDPEFNITFHSEEIGTENLKTGQEASLQVLSTLWSLYCLVLLLRYFHGMNPAISQMPGDLFHRRMYVWESH